MSKIYAYLKTKNGASLVYQSTILQITSTRKLDIFT